MVGGGESTQEWNFFDLVNGTTRRGETSNRRPEIDLGGIWMLTDPRFVCYLRIDVETLAPRVIETTAMDYWESGMERVSRKTNPC